MFNEKKKTELVREPDCKAELAALEDRMARLEKEWRSVEGEWTDWFDKYRRLHARLSKREQREDAAEQHFENGGGRRVGVSNPAALALLQGRR